MSLTETIDDIIVKVNGHTSDIANIPTDLADLSDDTTHRLVTDTEKATWNGKQDTLVSGTSIKTVDGQSLLGSGNVEIGGGIIKYYRFTDSTDIPLSTTVAGANTIGSSVAMDIPTKGLIRFELFKGRVEATSASLDIFTSFGFKIGSTVYPIYSSEQVRNTTISTTTYISPAPFGNVFDGESDEAYAPNYDITDHGIIELMISNDSLPTGNQTVELVCFEATGVANGVLKGTALSSEFIISITDFSGV